MKCLIFGNSGSGKTTLARHLAERHRLAHLDLDAIVWESGNEVVMRDRAAILASLRRFLAMHDGPSKAVTASWWL